MDIISKLIEIELTQVLSTESIEQKLIEQGISPLRWSIVKVDCNKLTISVAYENLC